MNRRTIADSDRTRNLADECAGILMALRDGEHLKGE